MSTILDNYALQRNGTILLSTIDVHHFSHRFHAGNDPSKNGVLPVQMRCWFERHKKLRSVRIRFARICHAHNPFSIVFVAVAAAADAGATGCPCFVFPVATVQRTRTSAAIESFPIARLNTEPGHNTMELTPAVRRPGRSSVCSNRRIRTTTGLLCAVVGIALNARSGIGTQRHKRLACFWTILDV